MPKFFLEVPHPADALGCAKAIKVFLESGSHYLTNAEWGCHDGDHCGIIIVEAEDKAEAMLVIPPAYRVESRVTELRRFSMDEIDKTIAQHENA
jgi:hypothetical protein